jgi:hypothetical protein
MKIVYCKGRPQATSKGLISPLDVFCFEAEQILPKGPIDRCHLISDFVRPRFLHRPTKAVNLFCLKWHPSRNIRNQYGSSRKLLMCVSQRRACQRVGRQASKANKSTKLDACVCYGSVGAHGEAGSTTMTAPFVTTS